MNAAGVIGASVVGLIGVLIVAAAIATAKFRRASRARAASLWANDLSKAERPITLDDIRNLPAPVRRWLVSAGVIGAARVQRVRLKQSGRIRQAAGAKWMAFNSEQYFTTSSPQFIWSAVVQTAGLPAVVVRDSLVNGHASMHVTAAGLVDMEMRTGPELDQGALLRYLGEIVWFPTAALAPFITWHAIDERSASAKIHTDERDATATITIDEHGDLVRFTSFRFMSIKGGYSLENQSFCTSGHAMVRGLRIPLDVHAVWHLKTGDLESINLHVDAIEYDTDDTY